MIIIIIDAQATKYPNYNNMHALVHVKILIILTRRALGYNARLLGCWARCLFSYLAARAMHGKTAYICACKIQMGKQYMKFGSLVITHAT
jgi:hypothetical protein